MSFDTTREEYRHLLGAQRVLADSMEQQVDKRAEYAQIARALVDVIRLKRDMRGCPDPRPVDVSKTRKPRKPVTDAPSDPSQV